jgi:hypothetical protein
VRDWYHLKAHLLYLYPDTATLSRNTKQGLQKFLNKSAKYHVCNEADVMKYYRGFFLTATPLYNQDQITLDDYNSIIARAWMCSFSTCMATIAPIRSIGHARKFQTQN